MKIIKKMQQKVMISILLCSLLLSPLTVHAEEAVEESIPEEEIVISEISETTSTGTTKNVEYVDSEYFVGENRDFSVMPMTDIQNTDPNNAGFMPVNAVVTGAITEEGQQRWYAFETEGGKLTLDLDFSNSPNVDYDLYLFQYSETDGIINMIDRSVSTDNKEHFSRLVEAGLYFVMVNGYSGYDAVNQYEFAVVESVNYDSQEVDDRFQDAYSLTGVSYSVTGTIDNRYDVDYQKYEIKNAGKFSLYLKNNGGSNVYKVDMLDSNGNIVHSCEQNTQYFAELQPCTLYFKVYCSTYGNNSTSTYTLSGDTLAQAASIVVTHAGDTPELIKNYQPGRHYWRVYPNSYVEGVALNSLGMPFADADVTIIIRIKYNNLEIPASGRTDGQGRFRIQLNIGAGEGEYSTNVANVSRHFYDIVPVYFESNGVSIPANVEYFYHFAYEILY